MGCRDFKSLSTSNDQCFGHGSRQLTGLVRLPRLRLGAYSPLVVVGAMLRPKAILAARWAYSAPSRCSVAFTGGSKRWGSASYVILVPDRLHRDAETTDSTLWRAQLYRFHQPALCQESNAYTGRERLIQLAATPLMEENNRRRPGALTAACCSCLQYLFGRKC